MRALLVPVKAFAESKKRLAPYYSPDARAELAEALSWDFLEVVAQSDGFDQVFVASQEEQVLTCAMDACWETIAESEQISESHSVDAASRFCEAQGVTTLLRLPIDLPLVGPRDIEALFRMAKGAPYTVMVPSRDGTGTNALLRSPPTLFPSHFGPGSFALHLQEAQRCGSGVKVLHSVRIGLDIDEIGDLRAVAGQLSPYSNTGRWLAKHGLAE